MTVLMGFPDMLTSHHNNWKAHHMSLQFVIECAALFGIIAIVT